MEIQGSAENWTAYNEVRVWLEQKSKQEVCIRNREPLQIKRDLCIKMIDWEDQSDIRTKICLFVHGDIHVLIAMLRAAGPHYNHRYLLGADRTSDVNSLAYRRYTVIYPQI
jgi:hypothetical protein